jgi:hypothetical protein
LPTSNCRKPLNLILMEKLLFFRFCSSIESPKETS